MREISRGAGEYKKAVPQPAKVQGTAYKHTAEKDCTNIIACGPAFGNHKNGGSMIQMENWATQAHEKLKKERSSVSGNKERAMADAVLDAIQEFCKQEPEFAQAVVQSGTFADCMKKVAAGTGNSISDLEAYKKAVQFYFPGAVVNMQLTIDLVGAAADANELSGISEQLTALEAEPVAEKPKLITLDLSSFF